MLLPKVLGMGRISKVNLSSLSGPALRSKENVSLDIVEDKIENLLRLSVCKLQPGAFDDQGHASSEQQVRILQ